MSTDTDAGANTPNPRRSRWLWVALTFSLALNLLFVGLLAGSWWLRGEPVKRYQVFTGAIERLMQDLPPAKQETARSVLEQYRSGIKSRRESVRAARRNAKAAVLAEDYDESRLVDEMVRLRNLRSEEHEATHKMFLGLLKELNVEERKKLLEYVRAGFKKRWRGKRRRRNSSSSEQ